MRRGCAIGSIAGVHRCICFGRTVESDAGSAWGAHRERRGQELVRGRRQDRQQLLKGPERLAVVEAHVHVTDVGHVAHHRRVVVWKVPIPGDNAPAADVQRVTRRPSNVRSLAASQRQTARTACAEHARNVTGSHEPNYTSLTTTDRPSLEPGVQTIRLSPDCCGSVTSATYLITAMTVTCL